MYLEHFNIKEKPFLLTPDSDFFFKSAGCVDPFNTLFVCVKNGEGFVKVTGEVGAGKTLLCRRLLESLDNSFEISYINSPCFSGTEIFAAMAFEFGMKLDAGLPKHEVLYKVQQHLANIKKRGKKALLIIDEAQALTESALEALRLLTNLETSKGKLLQVVLFGQPELDMKLSGHNMRQFRQRIVFSCELKPLTKDEVNKYVEHRLKVAGFGENDLFTNQAKDLLFRASGGIPRLVNILSHKSMLSAYGKGEKVVSVMDVQRAVVDTEYVSRKNKLAYMCSRLNMKYLAEALAFMAVVVIGEVMQYWQG